MTIGIAALLLASLGGWAVARASESSSPTAVTTTRAAGTANAAGKKVFASTGCGGCHTLADAGTTGTVGPNLDELKPSAEQVSAIVTSGKGQMPPYGGSLTPQQISDVADYVSQAAG